MALSVASAIISLRLDQFNSILYGTSLKHIARLQRIQHAAAWVVLNEHSRTSCSMWAPGQSPLIPLLPHLLLYLLIFFPFFPFLFMLACVFGIFS